MLGNFSYLSCRLLIFFKINFLINYFRNTIRVSKRLDPDQAKTFARLDLDLNCLQRLATVEKEHIM